MEELIRERQEKFRLLIADVIFALRCNRLYCKDCPFDGDTGCGLNKGRDDFLEKAYKLIKLQAYGEKRHKERAEMSEAVREANRDKR